MRVGLADGDHAKRNRLPVQRVGLVVWVPEGVRGHGRATSRDHMGSIAQSSVLTAYFSGLRSSHADLAESYLNFPLEQVPGT